jgi:hypothetical protein
MSVAIKTEPGLFPIVSAAALRLALEIKVIEGEEKSPRSEHLSIAAVRSSKNQLVTYPIVAHEYYRNRLLTFPAQLDLKFASRLQEVVNEEVMRLELFGESVFYFDLKGALIQTQRGVTSQTLWSEIFAVTRFSENVVRAAWDLPLGIGEMIENEWLLGSFAAPENLDMTHPYLHLFAHQPKYRIQKLTSHRGFVALSNSLNLREEIIHAIDYLEGVINE